MVIDPAAGARRPIGAIAAVMTAAASWQLAVATHLS